MSNASLKEQLQAVASRLGEAPTVEEKLGTKKTNLAPKSKKKFYPQEKPKKLKPHWLEYAQYGVELLKAYFPACFKVASEVKPLKKGIKQDLVKRLSSLQDIVTEDKACMVKSLSYYVNTTAYHKSVVPGAERIDLDGNPTDVVSAEEAQYSIGRHQAKLQAKRAQATTSSSLAKEEETLS